MVPADHGLGPDNPDRAPDSPSRTASLPLGRADGEQPRIMKCKDLKQIQRDNIIAALGYTRWKMYGPKGAAEILAINSELGSSMELGPLPTFKKSNGTCGSQCLVAGAEGIRTAGPLWLFPPYKRG